MPAFLALLAVIPAFLKALPEMIRLTLKIMELILRFKDSKWRHDLEVFVDKLIDADTPEKKRDAARAGIDLIHRL